MLVDGTARAKSYRVEAGQQVELELPTPTEFGAPSLDLRIAYEDEHLLDLSPLIAILVLYLVRLLINQVVIDHLH